jgi:hypothetical protein
MTNRLEHFHGAGSLDLGDVVTSRRLYKLARSPSLNREAAGKKQRYLGTREPQINRHLFQNISLPKQHTSNPPWVTADAPVPRAVRGSLALEPWITALADLHDRQLRRRMLVQLLRKIIPKPLPNSSPAKSRPVETRNAIDVVTTINREVNSSGASRPF